MRLTAAYEGFFIAKVADGFSPETIRLYKWALGLILQKLGDKELGEITERDMQEFWTWLRTEYRPSRMNKDTSPLNGRSLENVWTAERSFFGWAAEELRIARPDLRIKRPKYTTEMVDPFSQDEIKAMLSCCERTRPAKTNGRESFTSPRPTGTRDTFLILLLLDTGLRISETARLRIKDLDLNSGEITVMPWGSGQKTKARKVFLGKSARKAGWKYLASREDPRPEDRLFLTHTGDPMDRNSLRGVLTEIGKRAGVKNGNAHPHRFRHTALLQMARSGISPFLLMKIAGWSSLSMALQYLKWGEQDLKDASLRSSPADLWRL